MTEPFHDCEVWPRDVLDDEIAARCPKPFILQFEDSTWELFDTEDEACARQRKYRREHGRDEMTGEPCR